LRDGQEIVAVNDEKTPTWQAVIEAVMPQLMLGGDAELTVSEGGLSSKKTLSADRFDSGIRPEELVSQLGLKLYRPAIAPIIDKILPGSVAEQAGLRSGDRVAQAAGEATEEWEEVVKIISEHPGKPLLLQVVRDGRSFEIEVRPTPTATPQGTVGRIGASVQLDESLFESMQAVQQYPVGTALIAAWDKTWEISGLTLKMIGEMVLGRASVENLSGPIGIAQYAKSSAVAGLDQFLKFLGLISVSLGVLNLLPIPVLDGGHLLFFGIEAVRGRPVSEQTEALGQRIGLALILALMFLAVYNDLVRLAG
jgi:regulator of sigma E protease